MNWLRRLVERPAGKSQSPFGLTLQVIGLVSILAGVALIYPPAAFLVGGVLALLVGEKL